MDSLPGVVRRQDGAGTSSSLTAHVPKARNLDSSFFHNGDLFTLKARPWPAVLFAAALGCVSVCRRVEHRLTGCVGEATRVDVELAREDRPSASGTVLMKAPVESLFRS
jgi:hypothetical protein